MKPYRIENQKTITIVWRDNIFTAHLVGFRCDKNVDDTLYTQIEQSKGQTITIWMTGVVYIVHCTRTVLLSSQFVYRCSRNLATLFGKLNVFPVLQKYCFFFNIREFL